MHVMSFFRDKSARYFDSGSFTPVCRDARIAMEKVLREQSVCRSGNPVSAHAFGRRAQGYLDRSRKIAAELYKVKACDVIFLSGATEANITAMRIAVLRALRKGIALSDIHIVIGHEEHSSVHKSALYFSALGVSYTVAKPSASGVLYTPDDVVRCIRKNTVFLSLQYVNSQHGSVQPVGRIADACRVRQPSLFVHTDAAQASVYFDCSPMSLRADAVTVDSAKLFGPQGVGALLLPGSGRYAGFSGEHSIWDIRPGTPSVALICGFTAALHRMYGNREEVCCRARHVRDSVLHSIIEFAPDAYVHGIAMNARDAVNADLSSFAPHLMYISFANTNHMYLAALLDADGFAVSTATACAEQTDEALRIGVLPTATAGDARALARCIRKHLPLACVSR